MHYLFYRRHKKNCIICIFNEPSATRVRTKTIQEREPHDAPRARTHNDGAWTKNVGPTLFIKCSRVEFHDLRRRSAELAIKGSNYNRVQTKNFFYKPSLIDRLARLFGSIVMLKRQFVHYSLLLLEPGGKHVPFGHGVVPGAGKPAFHVHEGLNFGVWTAVLFDDYLMIVGDRTLTFIVHR